jgi:hypothetical protein
VNMVRYGIAVVIVGMLAVVVVSHFAADLGEPAGSSVNAGLSAADDNRARRALWASALPEPRWHARCMNS